MTPTVGRSLLWRMRGQAVRRVLRVGTFRCIMLGVVVLFAMHAVAGTVKLAWDPPVGYSPAGYMLYYGPSAGNYPSKVDVGNVTTFAISNLTDGATYHFAATDYNAARQESGFSNDVGATVPLGPPVANFAPSTTSGPAPLALNFSDSSTGTITSYLWTFGDGTTSTVANPAHVYSTIGAYAVSLVVTGPGGSNAKTCANCIDVYSALQPDIGLYRRLVSGSGAPLYSFKLDFNFDHIVDSRISFGMAGDVPLTGKVTTGGKSSLIIYRNGIWYFDHNRDGIVDQTVVFGGIPGDIPLTANFTGAGSTDALVVYRGGTWYVDQGLNGTVDKTYRLGGLAGDIPLAGDVNGDGIADLVIYRNGVWYVDTNRDGNVDMVFSFGGMPQDIPLLVDWDGDGKADLCIFRDGTWYINTKRDGTVQATFVYGAAGDTPLAGKFH